MRGLKLFFTLLFVNISFITANNEEMLVNSCGQSITTNTTLTGDITCTTGLTINANNITLDGNGFTIYMSNNGSAINSMQHNRPGIVTRYTCFIMNDK